MCPDKTRSNGVNTEPLTSQPWSLGMHELEPVGLQRGDVRPAARRHFAWWDHPSQSYSEWKCDLLTASAASQLNVRFDPYSLGTWLPLRQAEPGQPHTTPTPFPMPVWVSGMRFHPQ